MTQPILGILTLYLNDSGTLEERSIYQKMTIAGRKLGLNVYVFTPQDVNYTDNRIHALFYNTDTKTWVRRWTAFPHVIFDRCRIQRSHRYEQLLKFRAKYGHLTFMNRPLRNKWTIHSIMSKDARLSAYLPAASSIGSVHDIIAMLRKHSTIFLKPINGTGGRGILRLQRVKNGIIHIHGRDQRRRMIAPLRLRMDEMKAYLSRLDLKGTRYIAQQGINLKLDNGRVHDFRMLVQKDGQGSWKVTGCAGRVGAAGSITSNLHGGGHASTMDSLLKEWISDDVKIAEIKDEAERFGVTAAEYLELCCGQLCELAFDIAIDRQGRIWMLEVNPKPAREVFIRAGELDVYRNAIVKPLEYALWLFNQKKAQKDQKAQKAQRGKELKRVSNQIL